MEDNITHLIRLRPITKEDFNFVLGWSRDKTFCLANGWELNRKDEELFQWWNRCVNNERENFIRLGIEFDNKLIGYADLVSIKENTAELGIAIGDSTLWGKSLGYTAALHTIDYGSKKIGITIFDAETHEDNLRSQKMLEKLGFKEIGRNGYEKYLGRQNQLIQYKLIL